MFRTDVAFQTSLTAETSVISERSDGYVACVQNATIENQHSGAVTYHLAYNDGTYRYTVHSTGGIASGAIARASGPFNIVGTGDSGYVPLTWTPVIVTPNAFHIQTHYGESYPERIDQPRNYRLGVDLLRTTALATISDRLSTGFRKVFRLVTIYNNSGANKAWALQWDIAGTKHLIALPTIAAFSVYRYELPLVQVGYATSSLRPRLEAWPVLHSDPGQITGQYELYAEAK